MSKDFGPRNSRIVDIKHARKIRDEERKRRVQEEVVTFIKRAKNKPNQCYCTMCILGIPSEGSCS